MAKASTTPGQTDAPVTSVNEAANPFDGITGNAELDTLMAAGFGDPAETTADRKPAPVADPVTDTDTTPATPVKPEAPATADLSLLVEEDADPTDPADPVDPSDDPDDDDLPADHADMPAWVQKRLSKTAAQKRELRAAAAALEKDKAALADRVKALEASKVTLAPTSDDPLADINDPAELDLRLQQAKAVRDWVIANPEGGEIDYGNGKVLEISASEAASRKAAAEDMLYLYAPRRKVWLETHAAAISEAKDKYPSMFNEGTRMNAVLNNMVKAVPSLLTLPDYHVVLGDMAIGYMVRSGQLKAFKAGKEAVAPTGKPAAAPRSPVRPSSPSAPEPAGKAGAKAYQSLRKAAESGNKEGIIAAMAALED
jgi:hypothetical protein